MGVDSSWLVIGSSHNANNVGCLILPAVMAREYLKVGMASGLFLAGVGKEAERSDASSILNWEEFSLAEPCLFEWVPGMEQCLVCEEMWSRARQDIATILSRFVKLSLISIDISSSTYFLHLCLSP